MTAVVSEELVMSGPFEVFPEKLNSPRGFGRRKQFMEET